MATVYWTGDAHPVADVWTLTLPGSVSAGETVTITYNGKSVTVTSADATLANFITAIVNAWNNLSEDTFADCREFVAAAGASPTIVFTHDTPGVSSATFTVSDTMGAGNAAFAHTTTATGPWHADNVQNWSGGALPADNDTIIIQGPRSSLLYGLDSSASTPAFGYIMADFAGDDESTGRIGLARINPRGYPEFRPRNWKVGNLADGINTIWNIGIGEGDGSQRLRLDFNTVAAPEVRVWRTASGVDGERALTLIGTVVLSVYGGQIQMGELPDEAATLAATTISQSLDEDAQQVDIHCGPWTAIAAGNPAFKMQGGTFVFDGPIASVAWGPITVSGGDFTVRNTGCTATSLTIQQDGHVVWESTGNYTTAKVYWGGHLDFGNDLRAKTETTTELYVGAALTIPYQHAITFSTLSGVLLKGGANLSGDPGSGGVTYNGPPNVTFVVAP